MNDQWRRLMQRIFVKSCIYIYIGNKKQTKQRLNKEMHDKNFEREPSKSGHVLRRALQEEIVKWDCICWQQVQEPLCLDFQHATSVKFRQQQWCFWKNEIWRGRFVVEKKLCLAYDDKMLSELHRLEVSSWEFCPELPTRFSPNVAVFWEKRGISHWDGEQQWLEIQTMMNLSAVKWQ